MSEVMLEVKELKKYFNTPKGLLHAVDGVNFTIEKGKPLTAKVMNMWCGEKNHPNVEIKAKK